MCACVCAVRVARCHTYTTPIYKPFPPPTDTHTHTQTERRAAADKQIAHVLQNGLVEFLDVRKSEVQLCVAMADFEQCNEIDVCKNKELGRIVDQFAETVFRQNFGEPLSPLQKM